MNVFCDPLRRIFLCPQKTSPDLPPGVISNPLLSPQGYLRCPPLLVTRLTPTYDRASALSLTHVRALRPASCAFIILNVMLI